MELRRSAHSPQFVPLLMAATKNIPTFSSSKLNVWVGEQFDTLIVCGWSFGEDHWTLWSCFRQMWFVCSRMWFMYWFFFDHYCPQWITGGSVSHRYFELQQSQHATKKNQFQWNQNAEKKSSSPVIFLYQYYPGLMSSAGNRLLILHPFAATLTWCTQCLRVWHAP